MVDVPLLRKEIEFAKNHPEQHDQGKWIAPCGTYGCLAGNTVIHAGFKPTTFMPGTEMISSVEITQEQFNELGFDPLKFFAFNKNGEGHYIVPVETAAAKLLGLDREQAAEMFYPLNGIEDMEELFRIFTGETL